VQTLPVHPTLFAVVHVVTVFQQLSGMDETKKSVRFAAPSTDKVINSNTDTTSVFDRGRHHQLNKRRKLDKLKDRMNEDELDDVDEWNPDDDDDIDEDDDNDDADVKYLSVSNRDLREAKSQRRIKRVVGDNNDDDEVYVTTRIDNRTSLAAEGYEIEPFNMDQEKNDGSGYFDGDTYIFRKRNDVDDEPDAWVDSLNDESSTTKPNNGGKLAESDIRHDRIAMLREDFRRRKIADDIDDRMDNWTEEDLYSELLPHLEGNETIMGALIRYGQKLKVKHVKKSNTSSAIDVINTSNDQENRQLAQDSFNTITEAANALLLKGKIDIYDTKKTDIEAIIKAKLPSETTIPSKITSLSNGTGRTALQWEYQGNQDGAIHGPFSTQEMIGWVNAGYFVGSMAVQVRTITHPPTLPQPNDKSIKDDLLSDLYDDDDDDDENENSTVPIPNQEIVQRGEWILSDQVDFHKYL
jgi:CD2 antigen cytoplasmic tail-binding protein 2